MAAKSTHELVVADTPIQIRSSPCVVCAISVKTNGTNNATAILYDAMDGDEAVTNKIEEITVVGSSHYGGRQWFEPVTCTRGLLLTLSGTECSAIVEWRA